MNDRRLSVVHANRRDDVDLAHVGAGRIKSRSHGVGGVILGRQDDHAAGAGVALVAGPPAAGADGSGHPAGQLRLPEPRLTGEHRQLADGDALRP